MILCAIILVVIAISGCTQGSNNGQTMGVSSQASIDMANATADRILNSINSGSYSDYTQNFSDKILAQVDEKNYTYIRGVVRDTFGDYVSRGELTTGVENGLNIFVYKAKFSKGDVKFVLTMNMTNTSRVEGVSFLKP